MPGLNGPSGSGPTPEITVQTRRSLIIAQMSKDHGIKNPDANAGESLHRDAFGEVPRPVDLGSPLERHVIGEQLERYHLEQDGGELGAGPR